MKYLFLLALCLSFQAQAVQFQVDKAHSAVEFKVRHILSKTSGKFRDFSGEFVFDENKPEISKGTMTIKVASIDTNEPKRDDHLKSPDFFDAQKYDKITFESKKFKKVGDGKYKLTGDMTMRGVTKEVTFDVDYLGTIEKDPMGMKRTAFNAQTKINRKDFGIVWNKSLEGVENKAKNLADKTMVGDEVEINLNVEGIAKK